MCAAPMDLQARFECQVALGKVHCQQHACGAAKLCRSGKLQWLHTRTSAHNNRRHAVQQSMLCRGRTGRDSER